MSRKSKEIITITREELNSVIAQAVAQALAQGKPAKKATGKAQPKAEMVEFTNAKGETKLVSKAQAAHWDGWRNHGSGKTLDEVKAEFESKKASYKPSSALKDAIKRDRASITRKIAKEQYGFVGTKKDLQALKDSICK